MRRILKQPKPGRLVLALMWAPPLELDDFRAVLENAFGKIANATPIFPFEFTKYYTTEMGVGLHKVFVEIEGECDRGALPELKHKAFVVEDAFLSSDPSKSRKLNVDPMIVTLENIVIASSKNFPHRIYLAQGVYGDLAFVRNKGEFKGFSWTYPDYTANLSFFERIHKALRNTD